MNLEMEQMIFTSAIFCDTNVAEIARAVGMSPSSLYKKISRSTLKPWELSKIGKALGGEYVFYYSFPNGTKIGTLEKPKHKSGARGKMQGTVVRTA